MFAKLSETVSREPESHIRIHFERPRTISPPAPDPLPAPARPKSDRGGEGLRQKKRRTWGRARTKRVRRKWRAGGWSGGGGGGETGGRRKRGRRRKTMRMRTGRKGEQDEEHVRMRITRRRTLVGSAEVGK